jgi:hypothetical protein
MRGRASIALAVICLIGGTAGPADAHERRSLGKLVVEVGWASEPVFAGVPNHIFLSITDVRGRPVTDLGDTLQVEVSFGDQHKTLQVQPLTNGDEPGVPGTYGAELTPTRAGVYSFRFFGKVKTATVNQTFTSSGTTFDSVRELAETEFPAQDPSSAQLAERIDRDARRVGARIDDLESTIKSLTYALIGLGALLILLALLAGFRRKPKPATPM